MWFFSSNNEPYLTSFQFSFSLFFKSSSSRWNRIFSIAFVTLWLCRWYILVHESVYTPLFELLDLFFYILFSRSYNVVIILLCFDNSIFVCAISADLFVIFHLFNDPLDENTHLFHECVPSILFLCSCKILVNDIIITDWHKLLENLLFSLKLSFWSFQRVLLSLFDFRPELFKYIISPECDGCVAHYHAVVLENCRIL